MVARVMCVRRARDVRDVYPQVSPRDQEALRPRWSMTGKSG
jgi:hypothetical protein